MENETNSFDWSLLLLRILIFIVTGVSAGIASVLYGKDTNEIIRIVILALIGAGLVIFLEEWGKITHSLLYDNEEHFERFTIIYIIGILLACLFPLLPVEGWPYLPVFILLALLSNQMIGICTGATFLLLSVLLETEGSYNEFFLYFICGMAAIALFTAIDESFQIGIPVTISLMLLFLSLLTNQLLMKNEAFDIYMLFIPGVNILVCLLLLFILLKFVSFFIIHKDKERYMEINDPECTLLAELKAYSRDEYYHAIHTAYLSDKIAKRLGMDDAAAKAGGYYHRIGLLRGKNGWENIEPICEEYKFPKKVQVILKEYTDNNSMILSKETVVLLFADTIVASILYLFSKDSKAELDYAKIIDAVFKKKTESNLFLDSSITLGELKEMKKIFLEEKLYYDFLR